MNGEIDEEKAVAVISDDIPAISDDKLLMIAEAAEKRVDAMNKIKRAALRMTGAQDWTNQGGKPFPWASGSQKIARLFGMSWKILGDPTFEKDEGGHFSYTYRGEFSLAGSTIQAIGARSSKDPFFSKRHNKDVPPTEIDKNDVKKAAFTNCLGNGIMVMLGMKNLSWADLEGVGISAKDVSQVQFKKDGKADAGIASEEAQEISTAVEDVRKKEGKSKSGKAYVKYTVKAGGVDYGTFSESIAKVAKEAKEACRPVKIRFVTTNFGADIESLVFADDGPDADVPEEKGELI